MEIQTAPVRRAGRPLSFDRDTVLRQAMLAFWDHGYETTSVSDLTAAMGITAPSLYAAFGDKKQLFLEAMRLYAGPPEAIQAALDSAPSARAAAHDMLRTSALAFTAGDTPKGCLLASSTASGSAGISDVQQAVAAIRLTIQTALEQRIAKDMAAGLLPDDASPGALAAMVIALIQGMSVLARDGRDRDTLLAIGDIAMGAWPPCP